MITSGSPDRALPFEKLATTDATHHLHTEREYTVAAFKPQYLLLGVLICLLC
ncbi:hypothetical protein [Chamaesiphon minutus]|uniref:hypothetical protein n=1 Tax=Chamaesiphon minutus TaxID=1173032 RepID=UPI0002D4E632|nr:hypothetical protein [Chamaesiphon minutus]